MQTTKDETTQRQQQAIVSTIWKQCDRDRIEKTDAARAEAEHWKYEGDWYGYNFHSGVASGTIGASIIYDRVEREFASSVDRMAKLLMSMRNEDNATQIDAALSDAGYSC